MFWYIQEVQEADRPDEGFYIRSGITAILKNATIKDGEIVWSLGYYYGIVVAGDEPWTWISDESKHEPWSSWFEDCLLMHNGSALWSKCA